MRFRSVCMVCGSRLGDLLRRLRGGVLLGVLGSWRDGRRGDNLRFRLEEKLVEAKVVSVEVIYLPRR